ncbi:MAG: NAD(P)H-dependent oxidoreductase [Cyanobacteria bacterium P01_F01_bin.86]
MASITTTDLLEQLQWRYAVKKFDPTKTIPDETWDALATSLVLTPSSYGLQPWKFFVVTDPQVKAELKPLSWNQAQTTDCSHFVVFAIRKNLAAADVDRYVQAIAETRNVSVESQAGYRNMMVSDVVDGSRSFNVNEWAARQVYIALGNFMTCAALLGVDACPMEGIEPAKYDKVLNLSTQGYATVVACAAGYRADDDKYADLAKVRFAKTDLVEIV